MVYCDYLISYFFPTYPHDNYVPIDKSNMHGFQITLFSKLVLISYFTGFLYILPVLSAIIVAVYSI